METTTISVVNTIGDVYGVEAEDGQKVFEIIKKAYEQKRSVVLSFLNVEMLTTAFLNTAVGQLYKDYSKEVVKQNLRVENISESGKVMLKRVVETAKMYYKNPDALQRSIDNISWEMEVE
jgi:hypothetical protein